MPTCFVIMGFGLKTDLATGRVLDLDKAYKNLIKPAVTSAGYSCVRADEIRHSGVIDVPMYEMLYAADLVVADLSTSNLNAIFELGVRHALKPRATIIMAEKQFKLPFDASHIVVFPYEHLGPDIGFSEATRVQNELKELVLALKSGDAVDSPVYTVLKDLEQPNRRLSSVGGSGVETGPPAGGPSDALLHVLQPSPDSYAANLEAAHEAMKLSEFGKAKEILKRIYDEQTAGGTARPSIVQQLALATYKAGEKAARPEAALAGYAEAENLLKQLEVETTTDPETLGLWSAIHKRRAQMDDRSENARKKDLDEAIRAADRGFVIRRDYYNGTNLAYLLNLRASVSEGDDRIADNVIASRIRRDVIDITTRRLTTLRNATNDDQPATGPLREVTAKDELAFEARPLEEERFWVEATHADALYALGDPDGERRVNEAIAKAPATWMKKVAQEQHDKLKTLGLPFLSASISPQPR
jgi:hypothetical protein